MQQIPHRLENKSPRERHDAFHPPCSVSGHGHGPSNHILPKGEQHTWPLPDDVSGSLVGQADMPLRQPRRPQTHIEKRIHHHAVQRHIGNTGVFENLLIVVGSADAGIFLHVHTAPPDERHAYPNAVPPLQQGVGLPVAEVRGRPGPRVFRQGVDQALITVGAFTHERLLEADLHLVRHRQELLPVDIVAPKKSQ